MFSVCCDMNIKNYLTLVVGILNIKFAVIRFPLF